MIGSQRSSLEYPSDLIPAKTTQDQVHAFVSAHLLAFSLFTSHLPTQLLSSPKTERRRAGQFNQNPLICGRTEVRKSSLSSQAGFACYITVLSFNQAQSFKEETAHSVVSWEPPKYHHLKTLESNCCNIAYLYRDTVCLNWHCMYRRLHVKITLQYLWHA